MNDSMNISEIVDVLREGKIALLPSDTCYGLSCDATNPAAIEGIFQLKDRPFTKPLSILVSSKEMAKEYVAWDESIERLWKKYLPGPYTLILPKKLGVNLPHISEMVGVRMPKYDLLLQVAEGLGKPIVTTSANIGGGEVCYSVEDVAKQIDMEKIDYVLDIGKLTENKPSTLIFWNGEEEKIQER